MKALEVCYISYTECDPIWSLLPVKTGSWSFILKNWYIINVNWYINIITSFESPSTILQIFDNMWPNLTFTWSFIFKQFVNKGQQKLQFNNRIVVQHSTRKTKSCTQYWIFFQLRHHVTFNRTPWDCFTISISSFFFVFFFFSETSPSILNKSKAYINFKLTMYIDLSE